MEKNEKQFSISWALFLLGVSLGYVLGDAVQQVTQNFGFPTIAVLIPLVGILIVYRKVIPRHDAEPPSDEKQKDKK
jgi:hypothetical protein